MKNYTAENVDDYIENAESYMRPKLREFRNLIKETVPEAQEGISWGIPFYKYFGPLVGFSPFKNHVSFGLGGPALSDQEREFLENSGYVTGKKIIQIRYDQEIPEKFIREIILKQAEINKSKKS